MRRNAAAVSLIRDGRVGVAIAEHDAPPREPRPDLLAHVLVPRRHEQEHLDERLETHPALLEQPPHGAAELRAVGLAGVLDVPPSLTQPPLEPRHLGRLSRPLDALERDEHPAHCRNSSIPPQSRHSSTGAVARSGLTGLAGYALRPRRGQRCGSRAPWNTAHTTTSVRLTSKKIPVGEPPKERPSAG